MSAGIISADKYRASVSFWTSPACRSGWLSKSTVDNTADRADTERDRRLAANGFRVLRFWNNDVDDNLDGVLEVILHAVAETPPTGLRPVPPPRTGEG